MAVVRVYVNASFDVDMGEGWEKEDDAVQGYDIFDTVHECLDFADVEWEILD